jgi:hypothetical protein
MLARVVFPEKTTKLHFEVEVIADMIVINPFDFFVEKYADDFPFTYTNQLKKELLPYFEITESGPLLQQWVKSIDVSKKKSIINFLVEMNQLVWKNTNTRSTQPVYRLVRKRGLRSGSCRD